MSIYITINTGAVDRLEQAVFKALKLVDSPAYMRPIWEEVGEAIRMDVDRAFKEEGPGWRPLAASTTRARVRMGFSTGPVLQRTGELRSAATDDASINIELTALTYTVKPSNEYALPMQEGGRHTPPRPFLQSGRIEELVPDIFHREFRKRFRKMFQRV